MLDFRAPILSDREWIKPLVLSGDHKSCKYTFGNIFAWHDAYGLEVARCGDFFVSFCGSDSTYCYPAGNGDLHDIINELLADAQKRGIALRLFGLLDKDKTQLEAFFGDSFIFESQRDESDYIYSSSDLALLEGKKYHQKRNHIAAFEKEHSWSTEPINKANLAECIAMDRLWLSDNIGKNPEELLMEQRALRHAADNYDELGFEGLILRAEGEIVAFTFGEEINRDTFCSHYEKAFASVRGAYPMINREFARRLVKKYKYIDREEDTGDEGLRKSKLSYHPKFLLDEYSAAFKE